jgi:phosphoheptose isomerase
MDIGDQIARIKQHFNDSIRTKQQSLELLAPVIAQAAGRISQTLDQGGRILSAALFGGNAESF